MTREYEGFFEVIMLLFQDRATKIIVKIILKDSLTKVKQRPNVVLAPVLDKARFVCCCPPFTCGMFFPIRRPCVPVGLHCTGSAGDGYLCCRASALSALGQWW